jgi:hypothetical protein
MLDEAGEAEWGLGFFQLRGESSSKFFLIRESRQAPYSCLATAGIKYQLNHRA